MKIHRTCDIDVELGVVAHDPRGRPTASTPLLMHGEVKLLANPVRWS
jgi:hypothetical protein